MTVNQQVIEGSWKQIKGKVRERWSQLTENDLERARGNVEQLVGLIQEKTGVARGEVESYIESTISDGASMMGKAKEAVVNQAHQVAETAQHTAQRVAETAQETAHRAADSMRAGYAETERLVRDRPVESLAVCFGAGLITGVVIGLLTRSR
ncbi:MAG: CsbD family protein [Thermoguttaceae bacterium]